jgi:hypothetical protein
MAMTAIGIPTVRGRRQSTGLEKREAVIVLKEWEMASEIAEELTENPETGNAGRFVSHRRTTVGREWPGTDVNMRREAW